MRAELRKEPPEGTPVRCALLGGLEGHSGIYLGRGGVAELEGDGRLRRVSLSDFLNGTDGPNPRWGLRIYAACDAQSGVPLGAPEAAARARRILAAQGGGKGLHYDVLRYNCHRFTAGCVSGRFGGTMDEPFTSDSLRQVVSECLNDGRPVAWRPVSASTPGFGYAPSPRKVLLKTVLAMERNWLHDGNRLVSGLGMGGEGEGKRKK